MSMKRIALGFHIINIVGLSSMAEILSTNQIRLSLGATADSMTVTWATENAASEENGVQYSVYYATNESTLALHRQSAVASSKSYSITDYTWDKTRPDLHYVVPSNTYNSPLLHVAVLENLEPLTTYFYQVTTNPIARDPLSDIRNFTTVAAKGQLPGDGGIPSVTVFVGDLGQSLNSRNTLEAIAQHRGYNDLAAVGAVEFGIIVGDMSYADGNSTRWDTWGDMVDPLLSHFPMMFGVGNHEIEPDTTNGSSYMRAFTHYRNRFHMPGNYDQEIWMKADPVFPETWTNYNFSLQYEYGSSFYSYDVGLVHYIMLNSYNTYCSSGPGCKQYEFLLADLVAVDRTITPWIVVTMHAPLYNSNDKHPQGTEVATEQMRMWAESLFTRYGVNFVFAGHVHAYERFGHVGADGTLDPTGRSPLYITIGDGGNHEGLYDDWDESMLGISAFRNGAYYGYGTLTIYNATAACWEWRPNPEKGIAMDTAMVLNCWNSDCRDPIATTKSSFVAREFGSNIDIVVGSVVGTLLVLVLILGISLFFFIRKNHRLRRYTNVLKASNNTKHHQSIFENTSRRRSYPTTLVQQQV